MLAPRALRVLALVLVALSLSGAGAGFVASWHTTQGDVPAVGRLVVEYHLREERVLAGGEWHAEAYDAAESGASVGLRDTMRIQTFALVAALVVGFVAAALVAAPLVGGASVRVATLAALALLAVASIAGSALFARNFPLTDEGDTSEDGEPSRFWGERRGFAWGPGAAWWAEVASGVAAIGAGAAAWLSTRAGSAASASPSLP